MKNVGVVNLSDDFKNLDPSTILLLEKLLLEMKDTRILTVGRRIN